MVETLVVVWLSLPVSVALVNQELSGMPRVRAEDALISAALAQGKERSATFRRLIDAIDMTDGLVYVLDGQCGQGGIALDEWLVPLRQRPAMLGDQSHVCVGRVG